MFSQAIENDMDFQVARFDELNDRGQELVGLLNNDASTINRVNQQLLEFQQRWDDLVVQMERQSKEVTLPIFKHNPTFSRGEKK